MFENISDAMIYNCFSKNIFCKDISEFLHTDISEVYVKIDNAIKDNNEEWERCDPKTQEEIEGFYRRSTTYIHELAGYNSVDSIQSLMGSCFWGFAKPYIMHCSNTKCLKVLDYGGGIGSLTMLISMLGNNHHAYTYDLDGVISNFSKYRREKHGFYYDVITDKDIFPENIDMIYSGDVLEHVYDIDEHLNRIHNALKEGGLFFVWACFADDSFNSHINVGEEHNYKIFDFFMNKNYRVIEDGSKRVLGYAK